MEHSIEYYRNLVELLEYASEHKQKLIKRDDGWRMFPHYWVTLCNYLRSERLADVHLWDLYIQRFEPLIPIITDAKHHIEVLEAAAYDRNLANQEKIDNMSYAKRATGYPGLL